jgi:hypothetical protein
MKPLYRIFMGRNFPGYYKASSHYVPVDKDNAERLTHKEANLMEGKLRRLGYKGAVMELIEPENVR